jgi:hypothetical protein
MMGVLLFVVFILGKMRDFQVNESAIPVVVWISVVFGVIGLFFMLGGFISVGISYGHSGWTETTYFCCHCGEKVNYSELPAFRSTWSCPSCGRTNKV